MIVYRYAPHSELQQVLNQDMSNVGGAVHGERECNTHSYKQDQRYMHFMYSIHDIKEIRLLKKDDPQDYYICMYNIPQLHLLRGYGKGYYEAHGYDCDYLTLTEFAVPTDKVKPSYLKGYIKDEDKSMPLSQVVSTIKRREYTQPVFKNSDPCQ